MATYTTILGLTKQATNENRNTWGTVLNNGVIELVETSIAGETAIALTGDVTLTTTQGAANQARAAIIRVSSSDQHDRVITVPAASKTYVLVNDSDKRVKMKPVAGTATDVMPATEAVIRVTSTKAVRVATSGWGLHTTNATTSGTSSTFTLTGLGQHFNDILFVFSSVNGVAGNITIQPRTDAAAGGTAYDTGYAVGSAITGEVAFNNYRLSSGVHRNAFGTTAASPSSGNATSSAARWDITGGVGSVVFALTGGNAFNAGSISMYLR